MTMSHIPAFPLCDVESIEEMLGDSSRWRGPWQHGTAKGATVKAEGFIAEMPPASASQWIPGDLLGMGSHPFFICPRVDLTGISHSVWGGAAFAFFGQFSSESLLSSRLFHSAFFCVWNSCVAGHRFPEPGPFG